MSRAAILQLRRLPFQSGARWRDCEPYSTELLEIAAGRDGSCIRTEDHSGNQFVDKTAVDDFHRVDVVRALKFGPN